MSFTILIRRRAQKSLAAIPPNDRSRIIDQIQSLAANPRLTGSRKLRGRDGWRIRIGSWRVIYEIDDSGETVTILDIGHRKEVYRR